jgi:O-acetylserine/cysteine efflux transporter
MPSENGITLSTPVTHNEPMSAPSTFSPRDIAFAVFIVVSWGLNFVVMKWGLASFTPFQMGAARYLLAAFPLVFFIRPAKLPFKWVFAYGLAQGVGQFGFLFTALQVGMTASVASVLMQTQVFFTALFGMLFLSERLGRSQWAGLALAALGLACFATHFASSSGAASSITVLAFALNLWAAAAWAISNIVARKAQQAAPGYDALAFVVWSSIVPIVPFILLSAVWDTGSVSQVWQSFAQAPWTAWLVAAYLGWVATIAGYAMWTALLKRHAANRVAPLSLGVPVVGVAAGMLLLGESVSFWQGAGIACVVGALGMVLFGDKIFRYGSPQA